MTLFNKSKRKGGLMDEVRCDVPSYLIWKWHPDGRRLGEGFRENAIRWGSSLRVRDGEVAVFVYKQKNGIMQDFIVGPYDQIIKTDNFPVLASIVGLAYEGGTPFQAEVYFINLAEIIQVRFGVPFFDVFDSRFGDFGVPIAVRGTINFKISDYKQFIKLHRLQSFNLDDFQREIRDATVRYTKSIVANVSTENNIPLVQIETRIAEINGKIEESIRSRLNLDFGVDVSGVDISAIELDKTSEGYRRLLGMTRDLTEATIKAETEAKIKDISDKQRVEMENYQETLRIQREEGQYAQHKYTQTVNIGAYQVEKQAEVGVAGANALGQMGTNGGGEINLSDGNGLGVNMATMMASMAVGGVVGRNIAGAMNHMMAGIGQPIENQITPPPLPRTSYYLAIDGQGAGPFEIGVLTQMIISGQFKKNSLVWREGMESWCRADSIEELSKLFMNSMPKIPTE